jgi:hypothetical protein
LGRDERFDLIGHAIKVSTETGNFIVTPTNLFTHACSQFSFSNLAGSYSQLRQWPCDVQRQHHAQANRKERYDEQPHVRMRLDLFRYGHEHRGGLLKCKNIFSATWSIDQPGCKTLPWIDR